MDDLICKKILIAFAALAVLRLCRSKSTLTLRLFWELILKIAGVYGDQISDQANTSLGGNQLFAWGGNTSSTNAHFGVAAHSLNFEIPSQGPVKNGQAGDH